MKAAWYEKTGEAQTVLQIGELDNPVPNKGCLLYTSPSPRDS